MCRRAVSQTQSGEIWRQSRGTGGNGAADRSDYEAQETGTESRLATRSALSRRRARPPDYTKTCQHNGRNPILNANFLYYAGLNDLHALF